MTTPTKVRKVFYLDNDDTKPVLYHQRQVIYDRDAKRRNAITKLTKLVWLIFGLIDMLLASRFILKLINVHSQNTFANFVYNTSALFVKPFQSLIAELSVQGIVLEISSLAAIVIYTLVAWVLVHLIWLFLYQPSQSIITTYEEVT